MGGTVLFFGWDRSTFFGWERSAFGWGRSTFGWDRSTFFWGGTVPLSGGTILIFLVEPWVYRAIGLQGYDRAIIIVGLTGHAAIIIRL